MLGPTAGHAADDVAVLRAEIAALKAQYAAQVGALEARIDQLEASAATAVAARSVRRRSGGTAAHGGSSPARNSAAFNPAISVILAGNYADLSQDPGDFHFAGFMPNGGEIGPGERSFNLGESEVTFAASVDPYFTAALTMALSAKERSASKRPTPEPPPAADSRSRAAAFSPASVTSTRSMRTRRDFVDQPLVYQAFFGGQYTQDGVQAKWLAPTDLFLEFGAETGNGGEFPGTRLGRNGLNGTTLFTHVGGDLGDAIGWRAGLSWIDLDAEDRTYEDVDGGGNTVVNAFTGSSQTWVVDATMKWTPASSTRRQAVKLQAEYMHRTEDGALAYDIAGADLRDSYRSEQDGWYVQGVYQFNPRWRFGVRYDALDAGSTHIGLVAGGDLLASDFPLLLPASPSRITTMIDFSPSEFSRLRAQYAWDDSRDAETDRQLLLQYIYALGAHGAHKF